MTENQNNVDQDFKRIVEEHKEKVLNTCFGFLRNKEDAEDASQEVFMEVYHSRNKFREEALLSTWIYRIAVTKSLDILRKKNRKKRFGHLRRVFGVDDNTDHIADKENLDPEQQLSAEERSEILRDAIASLSESQKIAITLSKFEGFSNKEISEIMEVSLSSVESMIHRAKKNLYSKLFNYFEKNL